MELLVRYICPTIQYSGLKIKRTRLRSYSLKCGAWVWDRIEHAAYIFPFTENKSKKLEFPLRKPREQSDQLID